jgi:hypothetical protein
LLKDKQTVLKKRVNLEQMLSLEALEQINGLFGQAMTFLAIGHSFQSLPQPSLEFHERSNTSSLEI